MWPARVTNRTKQHSATIRSFSRGGPPWIELSKSINLFLWDPLSTEYAKQNENLMLSEIIEFSRLGLER